MLITVSIENLNENKFIYSSIFTFSLIQYTGANTNAFYSCNQNELDNTSDDEISLVSQFQVFMNVHEKVFLWRQLQSHKIYFEYGVTGGSTNLACHSSVDKIFTILQ